MNRLIFEVFTVVRMMIWVVVPYRLIVSPEDGDSMFLRNVDIYQRVYTAPQTQNIIVNR
jgi:hypothetical protein